MTDELVRARLSQARPVAGIIKMATDDEVRMLSLQDIQCAVLSALDGYDVTSVLLFGSYADGRQSEQSDVDLIVEFEAGAVSLLTISSLRQRIEDALGVPVDLVHGPIPESSFLDVGRTVELYAA